jgi:hypothetical protein
MKALREYQTSILIYTPIFESLDKIEGIPGRSITIGTNCITASAKWEESDIGRKVDQIRNIENVVRVDYNKRFNVSIIEPTVKVSESVLDRWSMASAIPSLLVAYEGDTGLMVFTSTSHKDSLC